VGALREKDHITRVWNAIANPDLHVVVQTAPAVRVALGEEFGMPMGSRVTGKMTAALKRMGFDKVFDTNTGADLTIMEEGTELLGRLQNNGKLPMITSCSPGWIKFCEHYFPEFIPNLSTCKSPHMMLGALLKSFYAEKAGVDPKTVYVVSVMPCTAKKYEMQRPEFEVDGLRDVDAVLTTRELARMIKTAGINFTELSDEEFDNPLGQATGAAAIFGATGGVMEAALRTVAEKIIGKRLDDINFKSVRGADGIKEFTVELPNITLKGAVVSGTGNARKLLERVKAGEADYHFIEVMGCPGGCITGGGQPIVDAPTKASVDVWALRAKAIYTEDESLPIRRSHENPFIVKLYDEYLGEPNGHKAHHLFHTSYTKRVHYDEGLMGKGSLK
jgi:NADP-reducing hydrogenase subunit HndD